MRGSQIKDLVQGKVKIMGTGVTSGFRMRITMKKKMTIYLMRMMMVRMGMSQLKMERREPHQKTRDKHAPNNNKNKSKKRINQIFRVPKLRRRQEWPRKKD